MTIAMLTSASAKTNLSSYFAFTPTDEQVQVMLQVEQLLSENSGFTCLIVKGEAGTGKTTLVKALLAFFQDKSQPYKLAAPTGRAAKVLSGKTGAAASTLHSLLYTIKEELDNDGNVVRVHFVRRANSLSEPCVYIIDEASMISDLNERSEGDYFQTAGSLLEDLFHFVKQGHPQNKLIFIGDQYQLPPVKSAFSPALDGRYLQQKYQVREKSCVLTEVKRQAEGSYIFHNARNLRKCISESKGVELIFNKLSTEDESIEKYAALFRKNDLGHTIYIAWRNEVADRLNLKIRAYLFQQPQKLEAGEWVVVNRSTYYQAMLITNGEPGIVQQVNWQSCERVAGMEFVDVVISFAGTDGKPAMYSGKVCLDVLYTPNGWLSREKTRELYAERMRHNPVFRNSKNTDDDPYLNALQLRYGYAITCHKAQGGEWKNVFLYPELPYSEEKFRWLYTAVTRASQELYSIEGKFNKKQAK